LLNLSIPTSQPENSNGTNELFRLTGQMTCGGGSLLCQCRILLGEVIQMLYRFGDVSDICTLCAG
jgi:hypothetical protein